MFAKCYILYVVLNDDSHVTLDNEAIYILYQLTMYAWEDVTMNVDTNDLWVCKILFLRYFNKFSRKNFWLKKCLLKD